jgi:selenocysteine-specific elongation factor
LRVIGTAGHVDHGKSALIEALTGTHPDRLREEREREMTIVLGFAWWTLPNGEEVGVVDVPGHRDFIENMLSGIGGIDAALFVVAADEGVMPQTREHLAILDLLQIKEGVIALTKTDLISEPEWLDLVEDEIHQITQGTVLESAEIVRVSAKTRTGLSELENALVQVLQNRPIRPDLGRPRLPIDRIFTMPGFGTIVTGTLIDGQLRVGEEVEILPAKARGRVRGLQTHKQKEELAIPGSRTAVNVSGVDMEEIKRGQVLVHPGTFTPTRRLDLRFRLLPSVQDTLKHNTEVKLFVGAAEVIGRLRLLGTDAIEPGNPSWIQLELREPIIAARGDYYILRRPSPPETLGGGMIVDPHPQRRYKRFNQSVLGRLESLLQGSPAEILFQELSTLGATQVITLIKQSNLEDQVANQAISELLSEGKILVLQGSTKSPKKDALLATNTYWKSLSERVLIEVDKYHKTNPLRSGMPREELKSRLSVNARLFNALIEQLTSSNILQSVGPKVFLPSHTIKFTPGQQRAVGQLLKRFAQTPYSPPSIKEVISEVGEDVYTALVELEELLPVSGDVVFRRIDYERMLKEVRVLIRKHDEITVAQVRDHFNTSRKYVLGLLEYLDDQGVTTRDGDVRRLC